VGGGGVRWGGGGGMLRGEHFIREKRDGEFRQAAPESTGSGQAAGSKCAARGSERRDSPVLSQGAGGPKRHRQLFDLWGRYS